MPLRVHLQQVYKSTGVKPSELADLPEIPCGFEYLWDIFWRLKTSERIQFTDMDAFIRITKTPLEPFEIEVIQTLDRIAWKIING